MWKWSQLVFTGQLKFEELVVGSSSGEFQQERALLFSTGVNLAGPGQFTNLPNATTGSVNHICFGMENFDADAAMKKLTERGVQASIRLRGDTKEQYFTDPDGIRVQLRDVKSKGGTGPLGDQ